MREAGLIVGVFVVVYGGSYLYQSGSLEVRWLLWLMVVFVLSQCAVHLLIETMVARIRARWDQERAMAKDEWKVQKLTGLDPKRGLAALLMVGSAPQGYVFHSMERKGTTAVVKYRKKVDESQPGICLGEDAE